MPRLHHLNLSHNFLEDFRDDTFAKNEELISLDISYNRFEDFNELTFKGLEVLEVRFDKQNKTLSYQFDINLHQSRSSTSVTTR